MLDNGGFDMRTLTKSRKRVATVVALLCALSAGGWALSAQAFASGAARATTTVAASVPISPRPDLKVHPTVVTPTTATNAHCGQVITASLTLNGDLYCPGSADALDVSGASVTLNLNGHTISNDGNASCMVDYGTSDTIENGTISGCLIALQTGGSKNTATKLTMVDNSFGLIDAGGFNKITANTAANNSGAGMEGEGYGATFSDNRVASNYWGMFAETTMTISNNEFDNNTSFGLEIDRNGATVTANTADYNGQYGIETSGGPMPAAADGGGNTAHGNGYSNSAAVQCIGVACN
jgi:hypothetical protein